MNTLLGKKVLATCQNWFVGPDGKDYKAIYGTLKAVTEASKSVGFIPNRAHANWFYEIGTMVVMGCQVMYLVECSVPPPASPTVNWTCDATSGFKEYNRPCIIYFAD